MPSDWRCNDVVLFRVDQEWGPITTNPVLVTNITNRGVFMIGNYVMDSWQTCHELEPSAAKTLRVEEGMLMYIKSFRAQMSSRWCIVEVRRKGVSLVAVPVT
ncbi:hypothetical protein TNCV_34771 [Trichonephila clavipes]|nr:hypothetical protein TNCV_34771 [Trichonephila clavipes]